MRSPQEFQGRMNPLSLQMSQQPAARAARGALNFEQQYHCCRLNFKTNGYGPVIRRGFVFVFTYCMAWAEKRCGLPRWHQVQHNSAILRIVSFRKKEFYNLQGVPKIRCSGCKVQKLSLHPLQCLAYHPAWETLRWRVVRPAGSRTTSGERPQAAIPRQGETQILGAVNGVRRS